MAEANDPYVSPIDYLAFVLAVIVSVATLPGMCAWWRGRRARWRRFGPH